MKGTRTGIGRLLKLFGYSLRKIDARDRIPLTESSAGRLLYFDRLMRLVNNIDGAIVECGVGDGDSLLMLALLAQLQARRGRSGHSTRSRGFPNRDLMIEARGDRKRGSRPAASPTCGNGCLTAACRSTTSAGR